MLNSINTNIAAYSAQANIGKASNASGASVARLSSGNRIVKASDDVAALSIGTSLKTGVTTLRQALANASQGTSLLQVADGALSQVSDILQRQKAIATQANSGTLSDTERSYLNQEFQALKSQIDQISSSTAFSSVKLLDGSLAGSTKVATSVEKTTIALATAPTTVATLTNGFDVGDVLTINGVDITVVNGGATGNQINTVNFDSTAADEAGAQAANLATFLNSSTDSRLNKFYWTSTATGALQAQARPGADIATQADATISYNMKTEAATSFLRGPQQIFSVGGQFTVATNSVTIGGIDFDVVASGAVAGQINQGANATLQAAAVVTALNADTTLNTQYTFTSVGANVFAEIKDGLSHTAALATPALTVVASETNVTGEVASTDFTLAVADDDITGANSGTLTLAQYDRQALLTVAAGNAANNDKITVGGIEISFTTATAGTAAASGKVQVGATNVDTANNLAAFLNSSTDARLANFYFDTDGAGVVRASLATGALGGTAGLSISSTIDTGANLTGATAAVQDTNSKDGLGENRTRALGSVSGSLLVSGGSSAGNGGSAIDLSSIRNNDAFIGKLGGDSIGKFTATYTAQDTVTFSIKVGDVTYSSAATDITNTTPTSITLTGNDANGKSVGGSFNISIAGGSVDIASINSQASADALAVRLNESFSGVTFAQSRDVTSFTTGTTVKVAGVEVARLDNVSLDLRSDDFSKVDIQSFDITAPTTGRSDAVFTAVINGETYTSLSGIGSTFDNNKAIQLQSSTNPNRVLTIVTSNNDIAASSTISMDVSSAANAAAVASAFRTALGLDTAGEALSFQVGAQSADTIGVKIASVSTSSLYAGADLDVTTIAGAQAASAVLDNAIASINSVRASVGALQSRLDFTSANLQSSIQNQDAARGTLLDTDVAAESTSYATSQVQLQAGIAVLAQANQLPQNLLKLLS